MTHKIMHNNATRVYNAAVNSRLKCYWPDVIRELVLN